MFKKFTSFNHSGVRRRDFLKIFGLALGGLAINQIPFTNRKAEYSFSPDRIKISHMPVIGMIIPNKGLYPHIGSSIAAGFKLAMDECDVNGICNPDKLRIMEVGTNPNEAIDKVKILLENDKVDILAGVINPAVAERLHGILEKNRTFLILMEAGSNVVRNNEYSPYIFHNNLGYWRSNFALGEWGVRNYGKKVFVASSFYESGYDALYAFNLGVEKAGGKVIKTYVSHVTPNAMEMNFLMQSMAEDKPDFILASYSGKEAVEFAHAYSSSFSINKIPLVCSSIMAENINQDNSISLLPGMISASSWSSGLNSKENKSFKKSFLQLTGRPANSFAVLGYDTGHLIIAAAVAAGSKLNNVTKVREVLRNSVINSPRGLLQMDSMTHNIQPPVYLQKLIVNNTGFYNRIIDELRPVSEGYHSLAALRNETRTGWLNAYLNV